MDAVMQVNRHRTGGADTVATIGNFDGMHRGHTALIAQVHEHAHRLGLRACVILFEPQPEEVLRPRQAPQRLMRLHEKLRRLRAHGIDLVYSLRFDPTLADMSARDFTLHVLQQKIRARTLIVGRDFRCGRGREGTPELLRTFGDLEVLCMPDLLHAGRRISSSDIRAALAEGRLDEACALLGRPYSLRGRVIPGAGRGRQLGFATANLQVNSPLPAGVYVTRALLDGRTLPSVTYLGCRPVFGGTHPVLETHILDHDGEALYGRPLEVSFLHRLRPDAHLSSAAELQAQMQQDIRMAAQYQPGKVHAC